MRHSRLALAKIALMLVVTTSANVEANGLGLLPEQTAALHGTVTDASGAVVPDTLVTARNEFSDAVWEARSDSGGEYVLIGLAPGIYSIRAKWPGFYMYKKESIRLEPGSSVALDIQLDLWKSPSYIERIKKSFGMVVEKETHSLWEGDLVKKAEQVPCPDGRWTRQAGDGARWPSCLNGDAVAYYSQLIAKYEKGFFPGANSKLETGLAFYHVTVAHHASAKEWIVEMQLEYSDSCGNMCGQVFQIIRIIHFDDQGKVVRVEGDDEGAHGGIS